MLNCRFTIAIHILCLLAVFNPTPLSSEFIARSVNTNPVVIRRILSMLRKAGIVKSRPGIGGGWEILIKPENLTLGRIYTIVRPGTIFPMHNRQPNIRCPVGRNIQRGLALYYQKAQTAMETELNNSTLADVLEEVLKNNK